MAQSSFPFDAGAGANVLENSWQKMAREWLATGVVSGRLNKLLVSADGSALSVSVASGQAQVEGFFYENDAALALTIATANASNPRIDTVVVRLDRTANSAVLAVVTGTAAASPTAPALSQTDTLYELPLADVRVPAAAGVIVAGDVTDRRAFVKNLTEAAANSAYEAKVSRTDATTGQVPKLQANGTLAFADQSGGPKIVRKTADESVVSSAVLQNDDALLVSMGANEAWVFDAILHATDASGGVADIKIAFTVPTGSTVQWAFFPELNAGQSAEVPNEKSGSGTADSYGLGTFVAHIHIRGIAVTDATAGNLQLQWAQNIADANAVTVKTNSRMIAQKVA